MTRSSKMLLTIKEEKTLFIYICEFYTPRWQSRDRKKPKQQTKQANRRCRLLCRPLWLVEQDVNCALQVGISDWSLDWICILNRDWLLQVNMLHIQPPLEYFHKVFDCGLQLAGRNVFFASSPALCQHWVAQLALCVGPVFVLHEGCEWCGDRRASYTADVKGHCTNRREPMREGHVTMLRFICSVHHSWEFVRKKQNKKKQMTAHKNFSGI